MKLKDLFYVELPIHPTKEVLYESTKGTEYEFGWNIDSDKFDTNEVEVRIFADFPHQSDEGCEVELVLYKNEPSHIISHTGDNGEYDIHVVNPPVYKSFVLYLKSCEVNLDVQDESGSDISILQNIYMTFVETPTAVYASLSKPKWAYMQYVDRPIYLFNDGWKEAKFLKFVNSKPEWEDKEQMCECQIGDNIITISALALYVKVCDRVKKVEPVILLKTKLWKIKNVDLNFVNWQRKSGLMKDVKNISIDKKLLKIGHILLKNFSIIGIQNQTILLLVPPRASLPDGFIDYMGYGLRFVFVLPVMYFIGKYI